MLCVRGPNAGCLVECLWVTTIAYHLRLYVSIHLCDIVQVMAK
jgi:hypothetical protein